MRLLLPIIFILTTLSQSFEAKAQLVGRMFWQSSEEYDEDAKIHIGINFHFSQLDYKIKRSSFGESAFKSIRSQSGVGFGMGISGAYSITKNVEFILNPLVILQSTAPTNLMPGKAVVFEDLSNNIIKKSQRDDKSFHTFELPLNLKIKSDQRPLLRNSPYHNYQIFLQGGGRWVRFINADKSYASWNNNQTKIEENLIFKNNYFAWETGLGIEMILRYFKIAPEISYTQSIGDLLDRKRFNTSQNPYMNSIQSLGLKGWQIKVIIE